VGTLGCTHTVYFVFFLLSCCRSLVIQPLSHELYAINSQYALLYSNANEH